VVVVTKRERERREREERVAFLVSGLLLILGLLHVFV